MTVRAILLASAFAIAASFGAQAVQPDEVLHDRKLEQRAREISTGIRCMVCQNENIDDSDAPLAKDLRLLVRDRVQKGDTDAQVRDYLVARYGDFVLLNPPFQMDTFLLWLTPATVLLAGVGFAISRIRTRRPDPTPALSASEIADLERLTKA